MPHRKSRKSRALSQPSSSDDVEPSPLRGVSSIARAAVIDNGERTPQITYWEWYTTALIDRLMVSLPGFAYVIVERRDGFELWPDAPFGSDWVIECAGESDEQFRTLTISAESDAVFDAVLGVIATLRAGTPR